MDTNDIVALIDAEIATLQQARALLSGTHLKKKPGRPKGSTGKKQHLTPEGREKVVAAQKRRWAAAKTQAAK